MRHSKTPAPIDLKGISLPAMRASLRTADLNVLTDTLRKSFGEASDFFSGELVVIDVSELPEGESPDWQNLQSLLASYGLNVTGVCNVADIHTADLHAAGLAILDIAPEKTRPPAEPAATETEPIATESTAAAEPPSNSTAEPAHAPAPTPPCGAMIIDKPLRSGQQIYARGRDLVLLGMVNAGAEVIADGSIHCYAPLRGRALAGAQGNTEARILTTCFEAELVSVAGVYRSLDEKQISQFGHGPVEVKLAEGAETLSIQPMNIR